LVFSFHQPLDLERDKIKSKEKSKTGVMLRGKVVMFNLKYYFPLIFIRAHIVAHCIPANQERISHTNK
jgi:hypothetical protein